TPAEKSELRENRCRGSQTWRQPWSRAWSVAFPATGQANSALLGRDAPTGRRGAAGKLSAFRRTAAPLGASPPRHGRPGDPQSGARVANASGREADADRSVGAISRDRDERRDGRAAVAPPQSKRA